LDVAGLGAAITRLELEGGGGDGYWRLVAGGRAVVVTADAAHDRLRIQAHVTAAEALDEALLRRVLAANFGTAGDARYAIDGTTLWSVYVHPMASLDAEGFAVALAQVVNLAADFGQDYGSGLFTTRAGAGTPRGRELIDALRGRLSPTTP
ncbi:MAG: type III secretion system chaperone, partial [Gammaproteobacteria bacterium]